MSEETWLPSVSFAAYFEIQNFSRGVTSASNNVFTTLGILIFLRIFLDSVLYWFPIIDQSMFRSNSVQPYLLQRLMMALVMALVMALMTALVMALVMLLQRESWLWGRLEIQFHLVLLEGGEGLNTELRVHGALCPHLRRASRMLLLVERCRRQHVTGELHGARCAALPLPAAPHRHQPRRVRQRGRHRQRRRQLRRQLRRRLRLRSDCGGGGDGNGVLRVLLRLHHHVRCGGIGGCRSTRGFVRPQVALEVHLLREALSAVQTHEGAFTGVDQAVSDEVAAARERLTAQFAKILRTERPRARRHETAVRGSFPQAGRLLRRL